jgi:hypothetical protein
MKTTLKSALFTAIAAAALVSAPAFAEVDVDASGVGFIGKGDVQLALDWNNHDLQANYTGLSFSMNATQTTTWTCMHINGAGKPVFNPRENITTGGGTLIVEPRFNPQDDVTGFFALGFDGGGSTTSSGHPLGSCPSGNGSTVVPGSVQTSGSGGGVSVSFDGGDWIAL